MSKSTISTEFINPPIPPRKFDWRAWFEGTEEVGPFGYGTTEQAAIADLQEQSE